MKKSNNQKRAQKVKVRDTRPKEIKRKDRQVSRGMNKIGSLLAAMGHTLIGGGRNFPRKPARLMRSNEEVEQLVYLAQLRRAKKRARRVIVECYKVRNYNGV